MRLAGVALALLLSSACDIFVGAKSFSDDVVGSACARWPDSELDVDFQVELISGCMFVKRADCSAVVEDGVVRVTGRVLWSETERYCDTDGQFHPRATCALPPDAQGLPFELSGVAVAVEDCPYS